MKASGTSRQPQRTPDATVGSASKRQKVRAFQPHVTAERQQHQYTNIMLLPNTSRYTRHDFSICFHKSLRLYSCQRRRLQQSKRHLLQASPVQLSRVSSLSAPPQRRRLHSLNPSCRLIPTPMLARSSLETPWYAACRRNSSSTSRSWPEEKFGGLRVKFFRNLSPPLHSRRHAPPSASTCRL